MPQLNRNNYSNADKRRALGVADLDGRRYAVLTIGAVTVDSIPDNSRVSGFREVVRVEAQEFGHDAWYYPNYAGVQALMDAYGENTDRWRGMPLVLAVVTTTHPVTKREMPALHVAPRVEWEEIINANVRTGSEVNDDDTSTARKSARKGTAKRGRTR